MSHKNVDDKKKKKKFFETKLIANMSKFTGIYM